MGAVWINPNKANMPEKEKKEWIAIMAKHHPEIDWAAEMEKLKPTNVKGTGRKSKKD